MSIPITSYPAIGHIYEVTIGDWVFHLDFKSETEMTFTGIAGEYKGHIETVQLINVTPVRPGLFIVVWKEQTGNTVVHIEDFENEKIYSNNISSTGIFV